MSEIPGSVCVVFERPDSSYNWVISGAYNTLADARRWDTNLRGEGDPTDEIKIRHFTRLAPEREAEKSDSLVWG